MDPPHIHSKGCKCCKNVLNNSKRLHQAEILPTPRNSIDDFGIKRVESAQSAQPAQPAQPAQSESLKDSCTLQTLLPSIDTLSIQSSFKQSPLIQATFIQTPEKSKPRYTHALPENFFRSHSPPPPLSPLIQASERNSPIHSPQIHPTSEKGLKVSGLDLESTHTKKDDVMPPCYFPLPDQYRLTEAQQARKTHRLALSDFEIKQTVGTGSFARVHLAKSKVNGKYYAIKGIDKKDLISRRQVEHVHNEREVLSIVSHPFLVKLWGTFQSERHVFFVMDYVPGGELFRFIRKQKRLNEEQAKFYAAEVTLAIEYLHSIDVAYRDLKPENILIDRRGHVKITDFGFAKRVPDVTWTVCGTPDYLAPEIIRSQGYTKAVDWWGLGVLIYEILCGSAPFAAKNPVDKYQKILECDLTWPDYFSEEAKDLIQNLLKTKPSERLGNLVNGANDIKNHAWFKTIDFDKILAREVSPPFVPDVKFEGDTGCFAYYEEMQIPYHLMHTSQSYCDHFPNF